MYHPLSARVPKSETWGTPTLFDLIQAGSSRLMNCICLHFYRQGLTKCFHQFLWAKWPVRRQITEVNKLTRIAASGPIGRSLGLLGSFWSCLELDQEASGFMLGTNASIVIAFWCRYIEHVASKFPICINQVWSSTWATLAYAPLCSSWPHLKFTCLWMTSQLRLEHV